MARAVAMARSKVRNRGHFRVGSANLESIEFETRAAGVVPHLPEGIAPATLLSLHRRTAFHCRV